ncbi:MAG: amidohydrolase family protein [Gemmatimonadales bacterium]|nr:amidohydrolase family protein [Gemmatimonadales bacterium]
MSGPAVANGAVLIDDAGRIVAAGEDAFVPSPPDCESVAYQGCALIPGLVNTHTHLELTGLAGAVDDDDFAEWIRHLIAVKSERSEEAFFDAASRGIVSCWKQGVTTICDTGSTGQVIAALAALGASGIAHHEVFGMHPEQCAPAMRTFERDLDRLAHHATGRVTLGVSPHAPYTVSGALYRASAELARAHGVPIAVHVAEPAAEVALLRDFTGTFADMWRARGVPRPSSAPVSPIAWLEAHGVLGEDTLCIHAVQVDHADVDLLVAHQCAIAHCPRSNMRHHAARAPIANYVSRGLRVGLGTDSEVSVAPIDLLAEARDARSIAAWTAAETLRVLTLGGAEALGMGGEIGALAPGYWGDVVAMQVDDALDPAEAVLRCGADAVRATWVGGRPLVSQGGR